MSIKASLAFFGPHPETKFPGLCRDSRGADWAHKVIQIERVTDGGTMTPLDKALDRVDTIVVISFDSLRTEQSATTAEVDAIRNFLENPDHLIFVCPHHAIGQAVGSMGVDRVERQLAEFRHHGDHGYSSSAGIRRLCAHVAGWARSTRRESIRPAARAAAADGAPAPVEVERALDELELLRDVEAFHLHPHLPQLERIGPSTERMDVLARQRIDLTAPPHPFTQGGCSSFDALSAIAPEYLRGKVVGVRYDHVQFHRGRRRESSPLLGQCDPKTGKTLGAAVGLGALPLGQVSFVANDFYVVSLKVENVGGIIFWTVLAQPGCSI